MFPAKFTEDIDDDSFFNTGESRYTQGKAGVITRQWNINQLTAIE
jgi:hypothetical protein